jgi:diacylglycerol kinase (ATP)
METEQKKLLFVFNSRSGKAQIKSKLLDMIDLFVKNGYEVTAHPTQAQQDALELVQENAPEYDMIVCSGGDGTVNEVVSGLMSVADRPLLGYIPAGTVNDFASSLHIPKDMLKAAHLAMEGTPFSCDIGGFNDRYFSYVAAFGIFTDVAYQTPQHFKNILGRTAYVLEGAKQLYNIKSYHMAVEYNGQVMEDDFIFGLVTNSTSVGGFKGFRGKGVKLDDGVFEVSLIKTPKNSIELQMIVSALMQKVINQDFITTFRTSELKLTCSEGVPWTLDGEYGGTHKAVRVQNHRQAIRIMTDPEKLVERVEAGEEA